jgi:hypothetical protein
MSKNIKDDLESELKMLHLLAASPDHKIFYTGWRGMELERANIKVVRSNDGGEWEEVSPISSLTTFREMRESKELLTEPLSGATKFISPFVAHIHYVYSLTPIGKEALPGRMLVLESKIALLT